MALRRGILARQSGLRNRRRSCSGGAAARGCSRVRRSNRRSTGLRRASAATSGCSTSDLRRLLWPVGRYRRRRAFAAAAAGCTALPGRRGAFRCQTAAGSWPARRCTGGRRYPGCCLFLGAVAIVVAIAAYPVVRGLTRRLERLQTGVETLGAGNLAARVEVQGRDEVARLAGAFNRAASRIEDLVNAHRLLLANASHELRTPLSRITARTRAVRGYPRSKIQGPARTEHRRARRPDR